MTAQLAIRLIEQFAAQAPFALWITDSRGVSIFANRNLHELLEIPDHPSGALGINLLDDPSLASLHLEKAAARAKAGENVELIVRVEAPDRLASRVRIGRKAPIWIKINTYALRSSAQKIEHFVLALSDVTETYDQREKLRQHLRDLTIFNKSRDARLARLDELRQDIVRLEQEIRDLGGTPVAEEKEKAP